MAYNNAGEWVPESDSVAEKVNDIIKSDSPLMRTAQTTGLQTANKRGVLNSSMAVNAAQTAMIGAATPIASQDSAQTAQKNLTRQQQVYEGGENQKNRDLQLSLANMNITADRQKSAASLLTAMEQLYSTNYASIMGNEGLDAASRAAQITSITNLRDKHLSFVEQMYNIDLTW